MSNLHISLTEFRNESRVLKEASSILNYKVADKIYVAALHSKDLPEDQIYEENIEVKRFKLSTRRLNKNLMVQILKYLEFIFRVIFFYRKKDIKIINIHSVALLPLGVLLKYLYDSKLIYDTHELETETNGSKGIRKRFSKILEKKLIKYAEVVFVVSENIADWYQQEYGILRPTVIMNVPKLFEQKKTNHFRTTLGIKDESVIILYQGGLSKGRGIELLLSVFKKREDAHVVIVFMGYGELEESIKIASIKNNNIFFHPAVAPKIVLEYTSSADIGISFIENTCLSYYYCMPNKLFEYAMVGLPVIVSNMKEMREFVNKHNIGTIVKKEDSQSINEAIEKILTLDIEKLKQNSRKYAEENAWEIQEQKMIAKYRELLA